MREHIKLDNNLAEIISNHLNSLDCLDGTASVVALLREHNQHIEILFVKRTETPNDPWSGQTAFPGGKRSPEDKNLKETVVRETQEETGINLRENCKFLGTLDLINSVQRPEMTVLPFVVLQQKEQSITLNQELAGYFWVPLTELVANDGIVKYGSKEYPAFIIGNNVVWGLTYNIACNLVSMLDLC